MTIYDKGGHQLSMESIDFFLINSNGMMGYSEKDQNWDPTLQQTIGGNYRWIKNLNVKHKTLKLLENSLDYFMTSAKKFSYIYIKSTTHE